MCGNCKKDGSCTVGQVMKILLIVGGINWGLVGLGMLFGYGSDWNVVHMLLGSIPVLEGIIYLVVGVAAVMKIFGCKCKKCMSGICSTCVAEGMMNKKMNNSNAMDGSMDQKM